MSNARRRLKDTLALLAAAAPLALPTVAPARAAGGSGSAFDGRPVTEVVEQSLEQARQGEARPEFSKARTLAQAADARTAELEALLAHPSSATKSERGRKSSPPRKAAASAAGIATGGDWREKLDQARKSWNSILIEEPGSPWVDEVPEGLSALDALEARFLLKQGKVEASVQIFARSFVRLWKVSRLSVVPLRTIDAFATACSRVGTEKSDTCRSWLRVFVERSSETAPERAVILSRHPTLMRSSSPSSQEERLVGIYKSRDADEAAFEEIVKLLAQEQWTSANRALVKFLEDFPRSSLRFRARWWIAQLRERSGERIAAARWRTSVFRESPFGYYGLVAALAEGREPGEGLLAEIPRARSRDPRLQPIESERWSLVESLAANGDEETAAFELSDLEARATLSSEFLVYGIELATRVGAHSTALRWATELLKRDAPWGRTSFATRWIFPIPATIMPLLQKIAASEGVDPWLLLSLAKQESAFDANALSSAGAAGLVQLMPATALEVLPKIERADLRDPDRSLTGGARYLRRMLNRYDGNVALALAAYNAGPGAVDRWIGDGIATGSQAAFIERIPFKETRDYVASILRNRWWYRRLSEGVTDPSLDGNWAPRGTLPETKSAEAGIQRVLVAP